jgi:hypothetical protein
VEHGKQHWIPQSYLSAWCDPGTPENHTRYVWVFPKASGEGRRKAPQNVFWETDMYTIRTGEEGRDLRLERGLSGLESDFAALRREKLEEHADLDAPDEIILAAFVAAMQARSRQQREHWRSQFSDLSP